MLVSEHSIQSLFIEMFFDETELSSGTGFHVKSQSGRIYLITNRHNVTGRDQNDDRPLSKLGAIPNRVRIKHHRSGIPGWIVRTSEPLTSESGDPLWFEHPTLGKLADFVALPLSDTVGIEVRPYYPANPGIPIAMSPADTVSVVGFPFGLSSAVGAAIWATGFLASDLSLNYNNLPTFLIDSRTREGQSGSPVISHRNGQPVRLESGSLVTYDKPVHRFLGIYSGRIRRDSDIGMVWKAAAIAELVATLP